MDLKITKQMLNPSKLNSCCSTEVEYRVHYLGSSWHTRRTNLDQGRHGNLLLIVNSLDIQPNQSALEKYFHTLLNPCKNVNRDREFKANNVGFSLLI